jgi:transcriptional regulator with XRE-family HTH domain
MARLTRIWTDADEQVLIDRLGDPIEAIAQAIGRTPGAVIGHYTFLRQRGKIEKVPRRMSEPPAAQAGRWTDAEDAYLIVHDRDSARKISAALGRSADAVAARRAYLVRIGRIPPHRIRRARTDVIESELRAGRSVQEVATDHGISRQRVEQIVAAAGLVTLPGMIAVIRQARRDAGRTQADVAAAIGLSQTAYSLLETGYRRGRTLSFDLVCRIAAELDLDLDDLFAREGRIPDDLLAAMRGHRDALKRVRDVLGAPLPPRNPRDGRHDASDRRAEDGAGRAGGSRRDAEA